MVLAVVQTQNPIQFKALNVPVAGVVHGPHELHLQRHLPMPHALQCQIQKFISKIPLSSATSKGKHLQAVGIAESALAQQFAQPQLEAAAELVEKFPVPQLCGAIDRAYFSGRQGSTDRNSILFPSELL